MTNQAQAFPTDRAFNWLRWGIHFAVLVPMAFVIVVAWAWGVNPGEVMLFMFAGISTVALEVIVGCALSTGESILEINDEKAVLCQRADAASHAAEATELDATFRILLHRLGLMCGGLLVCLVAFTVLVVVEVKRMSIAAEMIPEKNIETLIRNTLVDYRDDDSYNSGCPAKEPEASTDEASEVEPSGQPTPATQKPVEKPEPTPRPKSIKMQSAKLHDTPHEVETEDKPTADPAHRERCKEEAYAESLSAELREAFHMYHESAIPPQLFWIGLVSTAFIVAVGLYCLTVESFWHRPKPTVNRG